LLSATCKASVMGSNPFERTSVQIMLVAAAIALFANSAVDRTDDGLPWEVTLTGFCIFAVVFGAIYAKKTEIALSIICIIVSVVPTYYVHNMEIPASNWELGSQFSLATTKAQMLDGVFRLEPNASRFDQFLPLGMSMFQLSLFNPGVAISCNTSEIWHSSIQLKDAAGEKTHDYLLLSSPRKVKDKTVGVMTLARVPLSLELWPEGVEDYTMHMQAASSIIAPPTIVGELVKLDKGPAIEHLKKKHHLRPFLIDVYRVDYHFG